MRLLPLLATALVAAAWLGACGSDGHAPLASGPVDTYLGKDSSTPSTACRTPQEGCDCDQEGQVVDCGKVVSRQSDYVTCSLGSRTCSAGKWGACVGQRSTQTSTATTGGQSASPGGLSLMGLGSAASCPVGFDPCDPFCHWIVDSASGLDAGSKWAAGDGGLTEVPSVLQGCTSLAITASSGTAKVTKISPVTAAAVTLTATLTPSTCFSSPFPTTWTIDRFDYATITGTSSNNGSVNVLKPIVGDVVVTAYAAGLSASTTIKIKVDALDVPTTTGANNPASANQRAALGTVCAGTPATTATWLYPYANTYFPLGLPAPVPQYLYSPANANASNPGAVKVTLRYPAGSTLAGADFNYALVVEESNVVSFSGSVPKNSLDPQVLVPQAAWSAFEQTSRGKDADILIQRLPSSCSAAACLCTQVEKENARTIHFVDGQLKGTIFYSSYSSPQGNNTGAILAITPGATSPVLAVQPTPVSGNSCTVCHSINQDGSKLISNTLSGPSAGNYDQSRRYDMTTPAQYPSPTVATSYGATLPGDRFTFGGARTDGLLYMSHGGRAGGDANWHSPNDYSGLFSVVLPATSAIPVTNWPANVLAVTPRFSPDGTKLAFGFWGGSALPQSPTGTTLPPRGAGTRLAVMDFKCAAPPCANSTAANFFTVSNARDVTPGVTERVGNPSFTPAGDAVVYQRQYRTAMSKGNTATFQMLGGLPAGGPAITITGPPLTNATGLITITAPGSNTTAKFTWSYGGATSAVTPAASTPVDLTGTGLKANFASGNYAQNTTYEWTWADYNGVLTSGWSPSHLNTIGGALAELWMSNVPADKSTAATPTRLLALNGLDSGGASYLPQDARTISPPAVAYHRDGNSVPITGADNCGNTGTAKVYDYQVNYLPSVNPSEVGGKVWVVFTSRRMYGNVAYDDPWDGEPNQACYSGIPPAKKLWIAAIDKNFTPGADPSHPAFYLPGQELKGGNANGYWVSAACIPVASTSTCLTSDDCCGGSGASPTARCNAATSTCTAVTACKAVAATCAAGSDCCNGLVCGGNGKCVNPLFYGTQQKYQREYIADCPAPQGVAWRFLEWQATIPTGTSIGLGVQARALATDPYLPVAGPISMGSITASTAAGAWVHGASTVNDLLKAALVPTSLTRLLVTMTFNPNATGTAAPTLNNWRLIYDCVDTQ